jgi:hypothetical protein
MVTQQSWLFLRSFAKLRQRVLDGAAVTTLAHLGEHGFEETAAAGAFVALFTLRTQRPAPEHRMTAFRLVGPKSPAEKHRLLLQAIEGKAPGVVSTPQQADLLAIPETPFVYWLRPRFFTLLGGRRRFGQLAPVRIGLCTGDNERFLRFHWEVREPGAVPWRWCAKSDGYRKWAGQEKLVAHWTGHGGEYAGVPGARAQNIDSYFTPGLTYTLLSRGAMGARELRGDGLFEQSSIGVFPTSADLGWACALLNARPSTFLLRVTTQDIKFNAGYVANLPLGSGHLPGLESLGRTCIRLRRFLVAEDTTERFFSPGALLARTGQSLLRAVIPWGGDANAALLHALEGWNERLACDAYELDEDDVRAVLDETGTPAGWYPLIAGYDRLPEPPADIELPEGFSEYFASLERRELSPGELRELKARLRRLYEAGPGATLSEKDEEGSSADEEAEEAVLGAYIPIPTETYLEELSQKLQVHPVSVYNLLQELHAEGVYSPPEIRRLMEDWVSVALLLVLGYRWPEQDRYEAEEGPAIDPDLVDEDGIIPLVPCGNHPTAAERIRVLLERRFGEEGATRSEQEFRKWVGRSLEDWLRQDFFASHVKRFKQRPIAWHLTSPEGTFQALVLYHRLSRQLLQRLRATYAGALIATLQAEREKAKAAGDEAKASALSAQIEDVEEFRTILERIERGNEPRYRIRCRWKGEEPDGRPGPYAPDLDDGVKVNIRPFQEAGILARPVVKKW